MSGKLDKDAVVFHLKDIIREGREPVSNDGIVHPLDYVSKLTEIVRRSSRAEIARETLMRLHEAGIVNLADYVDD